MDEELYKDIEGLRLLDFYSEGTVRSAIRYKPRQGDVILVTYPKCGCNWTQFIIWNIITRGRQPNDVTELGLQSPFLEISGATAAENPARRGPIVTHLPYSVFPPVEQAKYIYVARNPYDCAVSMYHFLKGLTPMTYADVSFEKFLSLFTRGKAFYGDFFDHAIPWYESRHQPNILFITYEELKANTKGMVLKIADFLGAEDSVRISNDESVLQRILDNCSVQSMKKILKDGVMARVKKVVETSQQKPSKSSESMENDAGENVKMHSGGNFVRKGLVGDWKNNFTYEQVERTKRWITEKTRGTDVMSLWDYLRLP